MRGIPFCSDWEERSQAAARTWLRPDARSKLMGIVPEGTTRSDFNFSLEHKRVLNFDNVVRDEDNVKQDMSIDVYGRAKEEAKS
jgi:phosphatidylinositol glycan class S